MAAGSYTRAERLTPAALAPAREAPDEARGSAWVTLDLASSIAGRRPSHRLLKKTRPTDCTPQGAPGARDQGPWTRSKAGLVASRNASASRTMK